MSDANFASLSSTLLARKGGAKPAMRPQSAVLGPVDGVAAAANLEDLGWNDMGEDAPEQQAGEAVAAPKAALGGSASLSESSLIKKPALPPIDEREFVEGDEDYTAEDESNRVVSLNPLQSKEDNSASQNQVRESLDRIANQLEGKQPVEADNEDDEEFEEEVAEEAPAPVVLPKAIKPAPARSKAAAKGKRAAFTLRLDPERHLMLRLACTVRGSSAQQLVTDALDGLLAEMPEIAMLAAQVQRRPN